MTDLSLPTDYFKKRARAFLENVRSADANACNLVRLVFADTSENTDAELATDFGLMRAQHVVAHEHGFASWDAFCKTSPIEGRLAITMQQIPDLNDFGIGLFDGYWKKPSEERQAITERNRTKLRGSVASVEATVTWLRENVEPTKTITKGRSSYGLKHVAEKDIGYITNGVFIAAAIIAGYPYEIRPGSPNVGFGMSKKSLTEIDRRRSNPDNVLKRKLTPKAVEILATQGIRVYACGKTGTELAWREDGDLRTLTIAAYEKTPFIVRLHLDHHQVFASAKIAKNLGVDTDSRFYANLQPVRPKAELSVMPDEVEAALEWALSHDARGMAAPPVPPFRRSNESRRLNEFDDSWTYVWSARASAAYDRVHKPSAA